MKTYDLFKVSTTAPQSGNVLWVDVSSGMPIIRAFNGGVWEATSPGSAALAQIDALIASLAIMNSQLTGLTPLATSVTYAELVAILDAGELITGTFYRITDYTTTTVQSNTASAGHNFDIIVTALSTNKLSENASAVQHDGDTYFTNAKLEAWEIKYCINNDTSRFAWADAVNGKGVIYYMKDEWGNECPYDFKNIQFVRYPILTMPDGSTNLVYDVDNQKIKYGLKEQFDTILPNGATIDEVNPSFYYTFNAIASSDELDNNIYDASIIQVGITDGDDSDFIVQNNIIKELNSIGDSYRRVSKLNNICISNVIYNLTFTNLSNGSYSNTFGNDCGSNTFGNDCFLNTFGEGCNYNTFGDSCSDSTFGNNCSQNTFGNNCNCNTFYDYCSSNTFGNDCSFNTFGNNCTDNTFGNDCTDNTFGNDCGSNTFGNNCFLNTFGNDCSYNNFYAGTSGGTKKDYIRFIVLEDGCSYNNFYSELTTSYSSYLQRIRIKGLQNTIATDTQITLSEVNTKYEWLICYTSSGELKQYCPND